MTTFKLFGAALLLTAAGATPLLAQQVIQEPGNYAFYYPNADLLHAGSSRPADAMASRDVAGLRMAVMPHRTLAARTAVKHY
jgi:hypothetical protein